MDKNSAKFKCIDITDNSEKYIKIEFSYWLELKESN